MLLLLQLLSLEQRGSRALGAENRVRRSLEGTHDPLDVVYSNSREPGSNPVRLVVDAAHLLVFAIDCELVVLDGDVRLRLLLT